MSARRSGSPVRPSVGGDGRPLSGMTSPVQMPGQGPSHLLPPQFYALSQASQDTHIQRGPARAPVCLLAAVRTQPASAHGDRCPQPPSHHQHRSRDVRPTLGPRGTAPPSCLHTHPHLRLPPWDKSPPEQLSRPGTSSSLVLITTATPRGLLAPSTRLRCRARGNPAQGVGGWDRGLSGHHPCSPAQHVLARCPRPAPVKSGASPQARLAPVGVSGVGDAWEGGGCCVLRALILVCTCPAPLGPVLSTADPTPCNPHSAELASTPVELGDCPRPHGEPWRSGPGPARAMSGPGSWDARGTTWENAVLASELCQERRPCWARDGRLSCQNPRAPRSQRVPSVPTERMGSWGDPSCLGVWQLVSCPPRPRPLSHLQAPSRCW